MGTAGAYIRLRSSAILKKKGINEQWLTVLSEKAVLTGSFLIFSEGPLRSIVGGSRLYHREPEFGKKGNEIICKP